MKIFFGNFDSLFSEKPSKGGWYLQVTSNYGILAPWNCSGLPCTCKHVKSPLIAWLMQTRKKPKNLFHYLIIKNYSWKKKIMINMSVKRNKNVLTSTRASQLQRDTSAGNRAVAHPPRLPYGPSNSRNRSCRWCTSTLPYPTNSGSERKKFIKIQSFVVGMNSISFQSINQSINLTHNQSINSSIDQSINQSINRSINRSTWHTINQSITHSITQSSDRSINQAINQSINLMA